MDSLNSLREELNRKKEYTPQGKEQQYLNNLMGLWKQDLENDTKPYDFFQRKSKLQYMQQNEADSYALFNQQRLDRWRNNTRITTQRDKVDSIISAVADLNLAEEIHSFQLFGERVKAIETPIEHLIEYANIKDEYERKQKQATLYLLTHGTLSEEVSWFVPKKRGRILSKTDYENNSFTAKEGKELENTGKIWTRIQPLNRLVLGDNTQPFIELQPHIWKEYVLDYNTAKQIFGKWKNFQDYVKPVANITREWTALKTEAQAEDTTLANKVQCLVYEDIWADENAVICNGVLVTPVGYPMPSKFLDKQYSVTLTQLYDFAPNFAYGYSFIQRLHNDSVLKDFFYNALVDRTRQELEPPLVTSYRNIVNRHMFAPGKVTPVGADFKLEQVIKDQGGINQAMAMMEFIDANLDKVVPPIFSGGTTGSGTTAYEIREQMKNALRTMYNIFSSVAYARKKRAELVLRLILEKYPEIGIGEIDNTVSNAVGGVKHIFTTKGRASDLEGEGVAQVAFAKLPEGSARFSAMQAIGEDEKVSKRRGESKKWYLLDPEMICNMNHVIYVQVNPTQRKSKLADKVETREDYALYMNNPMIDPEVVTRGLLISDGKDPEKYMKKQQQPSPMGQIPGQPPGQPQPTEWAMRMPGGQPVPELPDASKGVEKQMNNFDQAAV